MAEGLKSSYDLIVIGAGPAGSSAAQSAAQRAVRVLLIDKRERIGIPVQCAELVSKWVSHHASFSSGSIIQSVETMSIHLPNGATYEMKSPGYMLDRSLFDKELATSAALSGTELLTGAKALEVSSEGVLIEHGSKKEWIRTKVIIGTDGVHSTAVRWTKQPPLRVMVALQYEVVLFEPQFHADIYFHPDYEGGYAWFFPKDRTANVGVGVLPGKTSILPELLNRFLTLLKDCGKLPRVEIVSKTGGSIPCELRKQTVFGNILLAGDAAGHAHPITGAGILTAVIAGKIAGRIGAEAIIHGDLGRLKNYETECHEAFGESFRYGFLKRSFLEENWNKPEMDFETLIKQTWVGFKEYYEERKKGVTPPCLPLI
jgi:geranylgeranyl reductase family protein